MVARRTSSSFANCSRSSVPFLHVGRVALHATFIEDRTDLVREFGREFLKRRAILPPSRRRYCHQTHQAEGGDELVISAIRIAGLQFHVLSPTEGGDLWSDLRGIRGEPSQAGIGSIRSRISAKRHRRAVVILARTALTRDAARDRWRH